MSGDEISINLKVVSIHPFFDAYGNEYVCVEFGIEAQKPPAVMSMPPNIPQELSIVMPIIAQLPRMLSQGKVYTNRLVLFLTVHEWEKMEYKYHYGEEVEIRVNKKTGEIKLIPLG
ncbi:MAG: arcadin 1 [Candidatus Bathyarchaeota archaeon]